ncbi:hypothetical protein ASPWEDRAFT_177630 [Aspergillus wentii DTO 134E9]|uniref:LysM domain-containing protein n=1 Tax=Aspergillus wentii DTO 134E9 TaxID=1073089 RepID=A0A1L9R4T6_ASPWE|nr:uncharacterized protein ASPWEDRAFT_177630 [Aspergillus wentii DTO 134E9]KAI9927171.1 hypothetical protein MW887_003555 [Aspergillus wentii]OJJ29897.1 hypothetical protein ASPWEDRAFT_177630 [Aspergillus wentii DTO 134E9]
MARVATRPNLTRVRKTIADACKKTDIISYDGQDWPATLIINRYIYTYDLSCRKDSSSGKFCDEIFVSFLNQSRLTAAQNCSDCMFGIVQIQLNSPFGYDDGFAEDFKSATSSCSATKYPFTSPPSCALNPTTTASPVPTYTPTCSSPYPVKANDTCNSISLTHNVSTLGIVNAGGLSPSCSNLQAVGPLCLPAPRPLYLVDYDDTCDSIIAAHSTFKVSQAPISVLCHSKPFCLGTQVWLLSTHALFNRVSATVLAMAHYDSGNQNNTQCLPVDHGYPGTVGSCSCFTIIHGYDRSSYLCKDITDDTRISLQQLTSWNPWVGADCDKGLYADLKDGDQRPVCIGVNSTAKDTASLALSGL